MLNKQRIIELIGAPLFCLVAFNVISQESSIKLATDVDLEEWQAVLHAPEGRVDRQV